MITSNVLHRVFRVRVGGAEGTAFTIDIDGREYLVTAKHVAYSLAGVSEIEILCNSAWTKTPTQVVGHAESDISVLALTRAITPHGLPMDATHDGIVYGQDVFFLGFPYGFRGEYIFGPEGYPMPFVKKGILSLMDRRVLILDGHNNPGFSGGPVVFKAPVNPDRFRVAGVISGYRYVHEPIYLDAEESGFTYRYNTGLIVTYPIEDAVAVIKANPIGVPVV